MKAIRTVFCGVVGTVFSISAGAQGPSAPESPVFLTGGQSQPTLIRVVPNPDEINTLTRESFPSCYRVGRCSAYDLHRFRDRPNRLTRLAPEPPAGTGAQLPPIHYEWVLAPITPEQNIVSRYRNASQIRDEYRAVGVPVERGN